MQACGQGLHAAQHQHIGLPNGIMSTNKLPGAPEGHIARARARSACSPRAAWTPRRPARRPAPGAARRAWPCHGLWMPPATPAGPQLQSVRCTEFCMLESSCTWRMGELAAALLHSRQLLLPLADGLQANQRRFAKYRTVCLHSRLLQQHTAVVPKQRESTATVRARLHAHAASRRSSALRGVGVPSRRRAYMFPDYA